MAFLRDLIGKNLGALLYSRAIFPDNPVQIWKDTIISRFGWRILKWLSVIFLSLGVGIWFWMISGWLFYLLVIIAVLLGFFILILFLWDEESSNVGKIKPTSAGLKEISQWRRFKVNLETTSQLSFVEAIEQFERYLPYAIALGVGDEWINKAAKANVAVPVWFHFPEAGDKRILLSDKKDSLETSLLQLGKAFGFEVSSDSGGVGGGGGGG